VSVRGITAVWTEALRQRGFDLVQSFDAVSYNDSPLAHATKFRLPTFDRPRPLGLLIAHGAALWQVFIDALRKSERLRASSHPLDDYTEHVVAELQRTTASRSTAFFSHRTDPVIPIQRIADVAGLAGLSPSHLSVHPRVGPWLGLRAVVVFAEDQISTAAPASLRPCETCPQPCLAAFERARRDPASSWRAWLAVRDSCPIGREARYSDPQIQYHYTKERSALSPDLPPRHSNTLKGG